LAIFVDGCFWHGCPEHAVAPKSNAQWWAHKLEGNIARDRRNDERLVAIGWRPIHVWEHTDPDEAANLIVDLWVARRVIAVVDTVPPVS
jgi:DNA mismatch endonuclease (patch repair protein)